MKTIVLIPAFNEENAVGKVVSEIPDWVAQVIVINNNSQDRTRQEAQAAGALVLDQPKQGYGNACLCGMQYVAEQKLAPDVIVFLDADYSDYPEDMNALVAPVFAGTHDFVIGSRALGNRAKGSMMPQQIWGNWLATRLLKLFYGVHYTDLGPFRAIRWGALQALNMQDTTYGWTVEMQLKAAKQKLRITEVPVRYRVRVGVSKISGTVRGTVGAGYKIISTIFRYL